MKKFGRNIVVFLMVMIPIYVILLFIWSFLPQFLKPNINYRIGSNGHLFTRIQDLSSYSDIDILFIGSSHSYRGFDTRIFEDKGYTAFNLGSSGQTPLNGSVLLKRYLEKLNPKLVIYEVFPGSFNSDGVESSLDIIANDRNDRHSLEMTLKVNNLKTFNTLILAHIRDLLGLDRDFDEPKKKKSGAYISGGYVQVDRKIQTLQEISQRSWNFDKKQFKAFGENLKRIEEEGCELVLIKAPVSRTLYDAFTDNESFDSIMNTYAAYYNFNKLIDLVDTLHFSDTHHLNHAGVEIFNKKVLELVDFDTLLGR